ncbi:MAG TPA: condensation domain-containing protein, partial [Pedobacter sp.]
PDPDLGAIVKHEYIAPKTEVEYKLAGIWQKLLDLEGVGVEDNFFELGGHSLLAMRLISLIRREMEVELAIRDLFVYPTIRSLSSRISKESLALIPEIIKRERQDRTAMSFGQERLWFIDQLEGSVQYHMPVVLRLEGELNKEGLAFALRTLVNRHQVLRTVIREEDGRGYQYIKDIDGFCLEKVNDDSLSVRETIEELVHRPFNLSEDYMLRAGLVYLDDKDHILVVTMHHIASDGWSVSIFIKEFISLYKSYKAGNYDSLSPLELQYVDYSMWQREYLQGEVLSGKIGYWKQKLEGVSPLQLPTDFIRPAVQSTKGAVKGFRLSKELTMGLHLLSKQEGTTLFMTLLAGFKVLLYRYSGQEDICVGTPTAGRQQQELEGMIGFFVNTLALRSKVSGEATFASLLEELKETMLEAYEHQDAPFEKIVEAVVRERDLSRSPLFQVMFVLQNAPEIPELQLGDLVVKSETYDHRTAQFDISFVVEETSEGLVGSVEYCTDLYEESTIDRMTRHYEQLLEGIVKDVSEKVSRLPMLTASEADQLLEVFNNTDASYEGEPTIVSLFAAQAAKTPDAVAVVFEGAKLTYKELDERSNQLAHYLISRGVKEETLVPICIDRSLEMIIGILGILKSGGAYVPIDPGYPRDRIEYMVEDTGGSLIITSKASRESLPGKDIIELDRNWKEISAYSKEKVDRRI